MNAAFIIAHENFRDEEYSEPTRVLESNNIQIVTASWDLGTATGKLGLQVKVDTAINNIDSVNYNAVVFIGGAGSKKYWDNPIAHQIAVKTLNNKKILAAICSAPVTLARAGVLRGKKATCFSGDKEELIKGGAIYTGNPVEQDGLIITADGPGAASSFGLAIVKELGVRIKN